MGVFVEAGAHEIVFTYHTRGLTIGVVMSLLAAGMLIVYCAAAKAMMKKKPSGCNS